MEYQLYLWQEKCLKEWKKKHCHGIVNVVTGAGKTYLALAAGELLRERTAVSDLWIKIVRNGSGGVARYRFNESYTLISNYSNRKKP